MAFSMSDYMRDKQKETSAPGTSVPRAAGFSMSKYLAGAEQTPTSISGAVAKRRNAQIAATKAKVDAYNAPLRQAAEYRKQADEYFNQRMDEYLTQTSRDLMLDPQRRLDLETRKMDEARLAELRKQAEEEAEVINWMLPAAKLIYQANGTPTKNEIAKLEEKMAQDNLERQYEFIQNAPIPGVTNKTDEEWLRNMILNPQPDPEAVAQYNAKKDELKAAADAEQAQVMSPANQYISMVTTSNDNPFVAAFNYYINQLTQSRKQLAYEQFTAAETEAKKREVIQKMQEWANEKPWLASGLSVGTSLLSGADYLTSALETAVTGNSRPKGFPGPTEMTQALRGGVSKDMSGTGQFFYDIGMSTADSYAAMRAGSGIDDALLPILGKHAAGVGGGIILALGAASNTANDIKSRGGSDQQALVGGAVAGILEGVFEKYSIGNLKAMKSVAGKGVKNILSNVAKNVLVNASEETATELGNIIFDRVFMQELSNYAMMVDSYMKQGISEESAKLLANEMLRQQVGTAALSGALQGLLSGGIETASSRVSDYLKDHKTYNINDTKSLINYAMSFPQDTASYQMGEQLKGKKNITSAEEGALLRTISQDIEQGNNKANPAAETISAIGNVNGRVTAENAPTASQTAEETVSREPVEVISRENAQAAQQNEKTAVETQMDVSKSNTGKKAPGFYDNGRFNGTDEDAQYLDRMAKAAGISIEMAEAADGSNGWIVNGEAYLSENAEDPLRVVAKHEITHHLQDTAGEAYSEYRSYVEQIYRDRGTLDQQIEAIQQLYRKNGKELSREAALDELAADYAGELLVNEALIRKLAGENPSLGQRILNAIRGLLQRLRTAFSSAEVKQLDRAARLWEVALVDANAAYKRGEVSATTNTRYSMAGVNARTADLDALSLAEEMERRGVDEETIFRDTGWIRGKDQKWRFEIDDSGMKYHRGGDAYFRRRYPEYNEFRELGVRQLYEWGTDSWTEQDQNRLLQLNKIWRSEPGRLSKILSDGDATLGYILEHSALFEAYPELEKVNVKFGELNAGERGHYNRSRNEIVLSDSLKSSPEATLLHEIQHAIQQIEGFSGGASPEFWQQKIEDGFEQRRNDRRIQAADAEYRSIFDNAPDEFKNKVRAINRATLAKDYDTVMELEDEIYEGEYADLYSKLSMADFVRRGDRGDAMTAGDLYENTAGEIEARETAKRRTMTADQRRESVPYRGDENTVFADGTADSYVMSKDENDTIKKQLREHQEELNNMTAVATINDNGWKGMSTGEFRQKIVSDLKKTGYQVDNPNIGVIEFDEKLLNRSLNYIQTDAEAAAYQAIPRVLKRGIEISGHGNHKGRGYGTMTIAAPIVLNGKRGNMAVIVMETKGNRYKVHRILTPEGKTFVLPEMANAESTSVGNITATVNAAGEATPTIDSASNESVSRERQSVKGSRDLQKQIDALERQNKRLKEQMKRTDVPKVRREVVRRSAKDLRSMYSSKIDVNVLTDRIEALYNKLSALSGAGNLQELKGVPSWAEVRSEARSIADAILAESRGNVNPMAEEYSEIRKEMRGRKISISDEYRADLESAGGYEGIRKQNFGTFSLTKDGTPIDTVYEELNDKYPVLFPDGIVHPADQLVRLSDVMQELKAVEGNPFENDLDATAQYLAGEIEERFYDTPNQKPTLADKMENTYHRQRLKDQKQLRAKLADQRRAYEKQVDEIHTRYADENRKRIENQNAAQRRETIYRHANRLGKMLERPTDKRHIPEQLRGAALHMLRYINTESNYQLAKGADGKYHRTDPMEVLYQRMYGGEVSDVKETGRTAAARALKAVYDDILKEGELSVDPDIGDYLEELAKMGNKPLGDMTRAELDTVWRVMQIVEHSITNANELHGEGRYRTVESMANALSEGVGNRKDRTNWAGPAGMVDQLLNRDMITPETFFHVLGDVGENIFRQMRNSADRQTAIVKEGSERAAKLIKESGVEFKKADKEHHTFHLDGGDLTLSTSQLMELYALSKRKQAMEHIYIGGLKSVGGVKGLKETGRSKPVKVTPADVSTMLETLTDKQKALMDGLQAYLSGDLAKHGNEESLKVYGYEKFKEKNYWPIKVSRTETKSDPTSEARSKTIPGYGMTKAVIPKASNSVELRSAIDTFAAHLNQMATYASWLGTNEDVTRLHNFKFTDDQNRSDGTVKELFERVYGKKGSAYLDALLSDIAQGTKTGADKTVIEGMFSRWKAAKVGGNLRVIVQQPTAILRAMSVVNPKYLAVSKNPLAGWKKALKYSPIAQWKDWGYFEMDTGRSIRELITGTESNLDKAKNAFMWGAGAADSVAWGHLWNAVEAETADKHEELSKGSKEFYEAVAARFAEVVDRTQVVDSVLHRTQIMRSNSYAAKISTSFMSEPSKIYNMVVRDLYDLKNAGSDEKKTAAQKQLARTSSALIVSFAINAAAQALVDGLRDDDRDKKYDEKFAEAFLGNFSSNFNPVSYIPYFKDVWSLIEGYTLNRSDMEGISDLVNAVGQLGKAMMGESEKTVLNAGLNAASRLGDLLGIPVSNLNRDAAAIFDTVLSDAELFELQYEVDKLRYNQDNASGVFYGDLYRSMNNDYDAYENIYEDMYEGMVEHGVSEEDAKEDIASAMENRMKKDLGVESVKSLPVRYSPPNSENPEDPFFALLKKARENDTGWVEQLDPGSIEIAHAVDEVRDQKAIEKIKVIASQPYGEELKKLAMRNVMSESLWEKYLKALNAGVTSEQYAEFLEAIEKEAKQRTGKPDATAAQADVEAVLYRSKLSNAKKRAIWESYGWKAESPW